MPEFGTSIPEARRRVRASAERRVNESAKKYISRPVGTSRPAPKVQPTSAKRPMGNRSMPGRSGKMLDRSRQYE